MVDNPLAQYGAIGILLVAGGWLIKQLLGREMRRADRLEEEVKALNAQIREMLPRLREYADQAQKDGSPDGGR